MKGMIYIMLTLIVGFNLILGTLWFWVKFIRSITN